MKFIEVHGVQTARNDVACCISVTAYNCTL